MSEILPLFIMELTSTAMMMYFMKEAALSTDYDDKIRAAVMAAVCLLSVLTCAIFALVLLGIEVRK